MKKICKAILIGLLLSSLVIFLKNECSWKLLKDADYGMPALIGEGSVDHLFIGSSAFRQGMDIGVMEEELAGSSYILAYNGNQPVLEYLELEHLIESGLKIDRLYVDLYVYTASEEPWISDEKILLETGLQFKGRLWKQLEGSQKAGAEAFYRMFITANNEQLLTWPVNKRLVNARFRRGGNIAEASGSEKAALDQARIQTAPEHLNGRQMDAVKDLIALAESNGIEVVFVETPKYLSVIEDSGYTALMKEYLEVLQESGVQVILDGRTARRMKLDGAVYHLTEYEFENEEPSYFQDIIHISSEGRRAFTRRLADVISSLA